MNMRIIIVLLFISLSSCSISKSISKNVLQIDIEHEVNDPINIPEGAVRFSNLHHDGSDAFIYSTRFDRNGMNLILYSMGKSYIISDSAYGPESITWLHNSKAFIFFTKNNDTLILNYYDVDSQMGKILKTYSEDLIVDHLSISQSDQYASYNLSSNRIEIINIKDIITYGRIRIAGVPVWTGDSLSIDEF